LEGDNYAAHHIVAGKSKYSARARKILKRAKIDINDSSNGVFLPRSTEYSAPPAITHSRIHTKKYYESLTLRLEAAAPENVKYVLKDIGREINAGTFPF